MRCKKKTKKNSNWTKWNLKMMIWTQIWRRKKKTTMMTIMMKTHRTWMERES